MSTMSSGSSGKSVAKPEPVLASICDLSSRMFCVSDKFKWKAWKTALCCCSRKIIMSNETAVEVEATTDHDAWRGDRTIQSRRLSPSLCAIGLSSWQTICTKAEPIHVAYSNPVIISTVSGMRKRGRIRMYIIIINI